MLLRSARVLSLLVLVFPLVFFPFTAAGPVPVDYGAPGPYGADWIRVTVDRLNGTTFTARLYFPAKGGPLTRTYDGSGAPYPGIVFGHGFQANPALYASTLAHLAGYGYFVIAPESAMELFPSHFAFAMDLRHSLTFLEEGNDSRRSWLHNQVDVEHFGAAGHSMGAGAAILAASMDERIDALAGLAPAETFPSATAAMANIRVPYRLVAGSDDGIIPPAAVEALYGAGAAPRQLKVIQGASHCGFLDPVFVFCDGSGLSRAAQVSTSRRVLTSFFDLYLKANQQAWHEIWGPALAADPMVLTTADAGFDFAPLEAEQDVVAGAIATYALTLTNRGARPLDFALTTEANHWPVTVDPITVSVGPGASKAVTVTVTTAAGSDVALVSARAVADGGTRAYVTLTSKGH